MQVRIARLIALALLPALSAAAFSQTPVTSDDGIPNGNWLFGTTESLYVLTSPTSPFLRKLDPTNGSTRASYAVTGHEALFGGLACDDAGDLYSIDGYNDPNPDRLFRIDRNNGAGTVVGETGFNWNFRFVYVHPITDVWADINGDDPVDATGHLPELAVSVTTGSVINPHPTLGQTDPSCCENRRPMQNR